MNDMVGTHPGAKERHAPSCTLADLELLAMAGQEIAAQNDRQGVFAALHRHAHSLLGTAAFSVYLLDNDGQGLNSVVRLRGAVALPARCLPLSDTASPTVRCALARAAAIDGAEPSDSIESSEPIESSGPTGLYVPLERGATLLGVACAQPAVPGVCDGRGLLLLRALCSYAALAVDCAGAFVQLEDVHQKLVAQEKMAALGGLVAGVAHELNTPIGNCLTISSTMSQKTDQIHAMMLDHSIKRSDLNEFVESAKEASDLVMRGLNHAADLVNSFKQVAVDRTTAKLRSFDLLQTCNDFVAVMADNIKKCGHSITVDVPPEIYMESYPGPLGQVITNLINNAMLHGFEGRKGGHMVLSASLPSPGRVRIEFSDDGVGISESNLKRIYVPFFTTKQGHGGSGLGLSISFDIITKVLGGGIEVRSAPGEGTRFILDLPTLAGEADPG